MEILNIPGVYRITNNITKKFYLGSTNKIRQRWNEHKSLLRRNKHPSPHLQNAWNSYGEENFIFEVILYCSDDKYLFFEQKCLDIYKPWDKNIGYNDSKDTKAPMKGRKWTEKHRISHSERFSGSNHPLFGTARSDETKKKIGDANRGKKRTDAFKNNIKLNHSGPNNSMWGRKQSMETKEKIRQKALQRKINPMKGRTHSNDTKLKISQNHKRTPVERIEPNTGEVKEYISLKAAEEDGFFSSAILLCCQGKQNIHKGYFWQYL